MPTIDLHQASERRADVRRDRIAGTPVSRAGRWLDIVRDSRGGGLEIVVIGAGDFSDVSLQLVGDLDFASAALVQAVSARHARDFAGRTLRVDMSRLTFCDCAGLRALLETRERQTKTGGALVVHSLTRQTARLVHLARLGTLLNVENPLPLVTGAGADDHEICDARPPAGARVAR